MRNSLLMLGQDGAATDEAPMASSDSSEATGGGSGLPSEAPRTWTEAQEQVVRWWAELPQRVDEALPYLVFSAGKTVLVALIALVAYRIVSSVLHRLEDRYKIDHAIIASLRIVLRWLAATLTVAAIIQAWGLIDNFWTAMTTVVALVAIGFVAVWSVLSNISCSIMLLTTRMFRIGDRVELLPDAIAGRVVAITLLYTTLETEEGDELRVPNNIFFQRVVKRRKGAASKAIEGEAAGAGDNQDQPEK